MHAVLANIFAVNGPKCSGPDMERDKRVRKLTQNFLSEVETSRWRSHRARGSRENSLIARVVFFVAVTPEVRRQRHRAASEKIDIFIQQEDAFAVRPDFFYARHHLVDLHGSAHSHFTSWLGQTFPPQRPEPFDKQEFDRAVIRKFSRSNHSRIVQHKQISRREQCRQFTELSMFDRLRLALQNHHSGLIAPWQRPSRDKLFRQRVIVIAQDQTHLRCVILPQRIGRGD